MLLAEYRRQRMAGELWLGAEALPCAAEHRQHTAGARRILEIVADPNNVVDTYLSLEEDFQRVEEACQPAAERRQCTAEEL